MKSKQIIILGVILAVLIAGVIFHESQRLPELATENYAPLNLSFDPGQVAKITIVKEKKGALNKKLPQVELVKNNGKWIVLGLWSTRADEDKIHLFLEEIRKAKGELRGKSKELFNDFGIADDQGFQISLTDASGKEILEFVIGTKKAEYGTLFIRRKESEKVYLTEANLYGQMGIYGNPQADGAPLDYWSLKNFLFFDTANVQKIEVNNFVNGAESGSFTLANENHSWRFANQDLPFPPAAEKVNQYLSGMKENKAQTVVAPFDPDKDYGFSKPRMRVVLTLDSGRPLELTVGNADSKDESVFYVRTTSEPAVFLVSKYYLEDIGVDKAWFFADNPLRVDATRLEKLVIHADKTELRFQPMVKKWDALTRYLDNLKKFKIEEIVDSKSRFGKYWIELKDEGDPSSTFVDIADAPEKNKKEYLAKKRGNEHTFAISETLFHQLFDNLSNLKQP